MSLHVEILIAQHFRKAIFKNQAIYIIIFLLVFYCFTQHFRVGKITPIKMKLAKNTNTNPEKTG